MINLLKDLAFNHKYTFIVSILILLAEIVLNGVIIWKVPYTEIDWKAYMSEVEGYLNGSTNYYDLKGDTGPLVYPAGFVYVFSGLYHVTENGKNIELAQQIFALFYLVHLGVVFKLYHLISNELKMPPLYLVFVSLTGYRMHSIFALRLFNDGPAMTIFYLSIISFVYRKWRLGSFLYSLSVSIKMNTILAAPALLIIYLRNLNIYEAIFNLFICALTQVLIGIEFLTTYPVAYLHRSFNLGRQFEFKWTVNWRFLGEELFLDRRLHVLFLAVHMLLLILFFKRHWITKPSSFYSAVHNTLVEAGKRPTSSLEIVTFMFVSNFIGIICARSLHYQFYVWYYHQLPLLVHCCGINLLISIPLLLGIEYCWNVYPSTVTSSSLLVLIHIFILFKLYTRTSKPKVQ